MKTETIRTFDPCLKYEDIKGCQSYFNIDPVKVYDKNEVRALAESLMKNGWDGKPILVYGDHFVVNGLYHLEALKLIDEVVNGYWHRPNPSDRSVFVEGTYEDPHGILDMYLAEDIKDTMDELMIIWGEDRRRFPVYKDLLYREMWEVFDGTWIEQYKDVIGGYDNGSTTYC